MFYIEIIYTGQWTIFYNAINKLGFSTLNLIVNVTVTVVILHTHGFWWDIFIAFQYLPFDFLHKMNYHRTDTLIQEEI